MDIFKDINEEERESFDFDEKTRTWLTDLYSQFYDCWELRQDPLDILGGRTLQQFWDDSERDFTVNVDDIQDENDPVKFYQSTISRDKTNVFIAHIASGLMYPDVIAQNEEQQIDRIMGRVSSAMLYWAHRQDGFPNENGQLKSERYAHTVSVKGTSFVLDVVSKNGLESTEIPVEELYFPTFWQPNIQKQSVIFQGKLNITYEEAEDMLGHLDNFQYVQPGRGWLDEIFNDAELKKSFEGIIEDNGVTLLFVWKKARPMELRKLKKDRKIPAKAERAIFYNVIANGIPMFPLDNVSPYKHGYYPISKCIFEMFRSDFLYGNSVPNKMREDKKWRDDWKTLIRYKGKLGALKPVIIVGGSLDEQIMLPAAQTSVPEGIEIKTVEGVPDGITQSDIQLLQMTDNEIDRGTVSPSTAGQRPDDSQTARAEVIQAANAEKLLEPFSRQYAYFMQSRSFHILISLYQFLNRRSIKKIAIPDQTLDDGVMGTLEVIFEDPSELSNESRIGRSFEIRKERRESRKRGEPKDIVYVNPSYINDIKFYLFSDATAGLADKNLVRQQDFRKDIEMFLKFFPQDISPRDLLMEYIRMKGYNERFIVKNQEAQQMITQGMTGAPETEMNTEEDMTANSASQATTGSTMPKLPV